MSLGAYARGVLRTFAVDGGAADAEGDSLDIEPGDDDRPEITTDEIRARIDRLRARAAPEPEVWDDPAAAPGALTWVREPDGAPVDAVALIEAVRVSVPGLLHVGASTHARVRGESYRFVGRPQRYAVGVDVAGGSTCGARCEVEALFDVFAGALAAATARTGHRIRATYRVMGGAGVGWVADVSVVRTT